MVISFPWEEAQRADGMTVIAPETEKNLRKTAEILTNQAQDRRIEVLSNGESTELLAGVVAERVTNELARFGVELERMTVKGIPMTMQESRTYGWARPRTIHVVIEND